MQTAKQSWHEQIMSRLRDSAEEGLDFLSYDMIRVLLSLSLGLIAGLALGLFLGWVVWPVQWTNTRPSHLEPDAKSQYIAAVSDAYVATRGDENALETARMRLIGMDDEDFSIAQTYFANTIPGTSVAQNLEPDGSSVYRQYAESVVLSFDSNIRINNINQLAADLGVVVDPALSTTSMLGETNAVEPESGQVVPLNNGQLVNSPANETLANEANEANEADVGIVTPSTSFFSGSLGSAVACLTALMLVFGGVYILVRLNQRMDWIKRPRMGDQRRNAGFDEHELDDDWIEPNKEERRGRERPLQSDQWFLDDDGFPVDPESVSVDTEFDSASFDDDEYDNDARELTGESTRKLSQYRGQYSGSEVDDRYQENMLAGEGASTRNVDRYTDIGPAALSAQASAASAYQPKPPSVPSYDQPLREQALHQQVPSEHDVADTIPNYSYTQPPSFDDNPLPTSSASGHQPYLDSERLSEPRSKGSNPLDETARRPARTRRAVLDFTTTYNRGDSVDYEEKHQIFVDGDGLDNYGRNVGECGIGINFKNGILLNNPHDVIALDVWLLDKVKSENLTSVKRILISEYVIEKELEDVIQRENHSDGPPIIPQPGLEFELRGANLSVMCRVLQASYMQERELAGIFSSLVVQMTVYATA